MDAGSGAHNTVPEEMTGFVKQSVEVPVIVGGGIKTVEKLESILLSGADIAVIGNKFESEPDLIERFAAKIKEINSF